MRQPYRLQRSASAFPTHQQEGKHETSSLHPDARAPEQPADGSQSRQSMTRPLHSRHPPKPSLHPLKLPYRWNRRPTPRRKNLKKHDCVPPQPRRIARSCLPTTDTPPRGGSAHGSLAQARPRKPADKAKLPHRTAAGCPRQTVRPYGDCRLRPSPRPDASP